MKETYKKGIITTSDRIYFQIARDYPETTGIYSVYRCELKEKELKCEVVDKDRTKSRPAAILPVPCIHLQ